MQEPSHALIGMPWASVFLESIHSIRCSGYRSLLALIGISIGCASIVALLNIGKNAANESINSFRGLGTNILIASFPHENGNKIAAPAIIDTETLFKAIPEINHFAPLIPHSTQVKNYRITVDAGIVGASADLYRTLGLELHIGRVFNPFDKKETFAVLGAAIAKDLDVKIGSRIKIDSYIFEVIGILCHSPQNPLLPINIDKSVFIPIEGMRRLRPNPEIASIILTTQLGADINNTAKNLKLHLDRIAGGRISYIQIPQQLLDTLNRQTETFRHLLIGLGCISLLAGGIGVMNVMLMNVAERKKEIGLRMAIGARSRDIRNMFLCEAFSLSAAGSIAGSAIGLIASYIFTELSGWRFSVFTEFIFFGVLISLTTGVFFGIYPALSAARLQPITALRDE